MKPNDVNTVIWELAKLRAKRYILRVINTFPNMANADTIKKTSLYINIDKQTVKKG